MWKILNLWILHFCDVFIGMELSPVKIVAGLEMSTGRERHILQLSEISVCDDKGSALKNIHWMVGRFGRVCLIVGTFLSGLWLLMLLVLQLRDKQQWPFHPTPPTPQTPTITDCYSLTDWQILQLERVGGTWWWDMPHAGKVCSLCLQRHSKVQISEEERWNRRTARWAWCSEHTK